MQWEMVTAQREVLIFVFSGSLEGGRIQNKENSGRPNTAVGPMAMSYSNKLGWTAKVLGPTSGQWKHKARAAQNSGPKENISLSETIKEGVSKTKRENPILLQELNLNIIELNQSKKGQSSIMQREKVGIRDGGVAATALQRCRAQ